MTQLTTAIKAVTVYQDRARVTRQGTVDLSSGIHQLEVTELPININQESIRARVRGVKGLRLLGIQVTRTFFVDTPTETVRNLEEQIESLQDEQKRLDGKTILIKHNQENLDSLAKQTDKYAIALAAGETNIENQIGLFESLRLRSEQLASLLLNVEIERRQLDRRLQKLKKEFDQFTSAQPRERLTATVELEVSEPGVLTLELSYVVDGAKWNALYDMRFSERVNNPNIDIGYLAEISQKTGEDWNNVSVWLSTARPALAEKIPELDPWYIAPVQPRVAPEKRAVATYAAIPQPMALSEPEGAAFLAEEVEAEYRYAKVETSGGVITYSIPGLVNIPCNGTPQKVFFASYPIPPKLDYVAAPKLVQATYRRAKVINASTYTLLSGKANLFSEEEFIGTTNLELIPPEGEIELYLGIEDRVKLERKLKRREIEKKIIGGKKRILFGYEVEIENLLPDKIQLTIHDQFPVSKHEEIKVRLEYVEPQPIEQSELNLLKWELSLASKEKKTLRFGFSVEFPQWMQVPGLP